MAPSPGWGHWGVRDSRRSRSGTGSVVSKSVLLKGCAHGSPGVLRKRTLIQGPGQNLGLSVSNQLPGDTDAVGTTLSIARF